MNGHAIRKTKESKPDSLSFPDSYSLRLVFSRTYSSHVGLTINCWQKILWFPFWETRRSASQCPINANFPSFFCFKSHWSNSNYMGIFLQICEWIRNRIIFFFLFSFYNDDKISKIKQYYTNVACDVEEFFHHLALLSFKLFLFLCVCLLKIHTRFSSSCACISLFVFLPYSLVINRVPKLWSQI